MVGVTKTRKSHAATERDFEELTKNFLLLQEAFIAVNQKRESEIWAKIERVKEQLKAEISAKQKQLDVRPITIPADDYSRKYGVVVGLGWAVELLERDIKL